MVHEREASQTRLSVNELDNSQQEPKTQSIHVPNSERQRVMTSMKAAQAERPQRIERMKVRQQEGMEAAHKITQMLKQDFGVKRVVLFGSLLHPEHMHEGSDIDLAVWNLPDDQFFDAWTAANYILGPYDFPPVDLVPIEKAYPAIKTMIAKEGVEL